MGALNSQLQVIKTSSPLKLVAMILLKVALNAKIDQSIKKFELHQWRNG
jgi:hypothetical protein